MSLPWHDLLMMKFNRFEWLALLVAALARIAAHASLMQTRHARHVLVDAHTYWSQAAAMVGGQDPFVDGFYQPPGYPLILSFIQSAFGDGLMAPRVIQQLCGLLTVVLLMRVGRRVGRRPWAGAVVGLLYGLYPPALMFELDLLTPAWVGLAVAGIAYLLMDANSHRFAMAAGLAALSAAIHPSMLLVAFSVVGVAILQGAGVRGCVVALGLGLLPMTSANVERFGVWQTGSNNAGINFYIGNNQDWKETTFIRAGLRFRQLALEAEPHRRDSFERNDYWSSRAWSSIAAAPHRWLAAMGTRAVWSVNNVEIPRNEDHRCRTERGPLAWLAWMPVQYGWVWVLAVVALVAEPRTRRRWLPLWAGLHLPLILFIVSDRYRLASWPIVCLLAPLGLSALGRWWRSRDWRAALGVGLVGCIPMLPIDARTEMDPAWCDHTEANLAVADGDMMTARRLYERAVAANPGDWSARRWLAIALMKEGRLPEAAEQVDAVLRDFPDSFPMLRLGAAIEERRGRLARAAELMLRAYRVPGDRTATGVKVLKLWARVGERRQMQSLLAEDDALARRWRRLSGD
ncbi:MAG: tetratricopeptide repeat protein [Myxococcota bacterium]|nr:tetratricopeptide repeat protein [Myxococcota bacterium]